MATWQGWAGDVLKAGGWPDEIGNEAFLTDWQVYEESGAKFNPLNTTEPEPGATIYNTLPDGQHVWNYPAAGVGAHATVVTFENGYYPSIVAALKTGDPYGYIDPNGVADNIRTWGTPNFAAAYLLKAGSPAPKPPPAQPPDKYGDSATLEGGEWNAGWNHLTHSVSRTLPTALAQAEASRQRTLRHLAHASKVVR